MILSTDPYLDRKYDRANYNCFHFAREVWRDLTGVDILPDDAPDLDRKFLKLSHFKSRTKHEKLIDPCIVIMSRTGCESHMGVYLRGSLLHLHDYGVSYQPLELATRGFDTIRYYT